MPRIIAFMRRRGIVGVDVHKLHKPEVPEMGGVGLIIGVTGGCILLFLGSGFLGFGLPDYRILIFLSVILLAGLVGAVDDLRPLGAKTKTLLTAATSLPILLSSWIIVGLGMSPPLETAYNPQPRFPFLGQTRFTIIYPLMIPLVVAVPANAVNMIDVFNGVMPIATILIFIGMLIASLLTVSVGVPGSELGILLSCVMIGGLFAYFLFNRNPAQVFGGDSGSLFIGTAIGALAIMGRIELVTMIALFPAIMNAFSSLMSIGGLLERRKIKGRPTIFQADGTLAASLDPHAPLTLTRLVLARGPLTEKQIALSLAVLSLAGSSLAVMTFFLIPFEEIGFLIPWPFTLLLTVIPVLLILGVYLTLRTNDQLGIRLVGIIGLMVEVWVVLMAGFAALDFLIQIPIPFGNIISPIFGAVYVLAWLALWYLTTRLVFNYEVRIGISSTVKPS